MIVWTVTVARKNTAPFVHVCADEVAARALGKSFREDFNAAGFSIADVAIYIQQHGIVTYEDLLEDE